MNKQIRMSALNDELSQVRTRFRKTRYRGLPKQVAKLNMVFALANLILADRPCLAA